MAKHCLMIGKRTVRDEVVYHLIVTSATQAELRTETLAGIVTEQREYVGSRAQVQALCRWAQLTGLVAGGPTA